MTIKVYQRGDLVRLDVIVKDINGTLIDPGTLEVRVTKPSGAQVSRTWAGGTVTRDSVGTFHRDESVDEVGEWYWSAITTGGGQAAENWQFTVEATQ